MSNRGGAGVPREPSEAVCPMVTADIVGERSIGVGDRATGRGGIECTEARGIVAGSPHSGGDGSQQF